MIARIGIDLGGTKIEGIRLEADGEISGRLRRETPRNDYPATVAAIVDLALELDPARELKIGVGTPGSWVARQGRMQNCNSTWLNRKPLLDDLNRALDGRVRIANDADCFALSEAHGGSADGGGIVFGVILGTGVGGGLVVDGRLLAGPNGLSGEWGHTPLVQTEPGLPSRTCYCGRTDCVETFLSGPGLLLTHQTLWPQETDGPPSAQVVYERAALAAAPAEWWRLDDVPEPDARARARVTLITYCRMLGANLARIVNTLDPHVIVFGGGLSQMREMYPAVRAFMAAHVFGEVFDTELRPPRFGAASGVRGAAWLWSASER
jgi:fructokinase